MNEHILSTALPGAEDSKAGSRRRRRNAAQWRALIDQQQTSGMSVRGFCQRAGLNETSFYAWRRRLEAAAESGSFIRLEPKGHAGSGADTIEVRFACGATLCCASDHLAALVRMLKGDHGEAGRC